MMKTFILSVIGSIFLLSCATAPLVVNENDSKLRMVGGKSALLEAIEYPEYALEKGIEGTVILLADIDTAGMVQKCKVIKGNDHLNAVAVKAFEQQRFYPYILNGKKHAVRVVFPISFSISTDIDIRDFEHERIMMFADQYLDQPLKTLNDFPCERSPGSSSAYYSEGETWWPVSGSPDAPYIVRDGEMNPGAFMSHKLLLQNLSKIVSTLTAATLVSGNSIYAEKAVEYLKAWFVDMNSRMEPHMRHAQAIPNRNPGRDTGIYESLPLVEVVISLPFLDKYLSDGDRTAINDWLREFLNYLSNDPKGVSVRTRHDVSSMAWLLQFTAISRYFNDTTLLERAETYYENILSTYMPANGSALLNMKYKDNIFLNADILTAVAVLLADETYRSWEFRSSGGKRISDLVNDIYRDILNEEQDKADMYHGRYLSLLFAGKAYEDHRFLELWRDLQEGETMETEFPLRQPVLWLK